MAIRTGPSQRVQGALRGLWAAASAHRPPCRSPRAGMASSGETSRRKLAGLVPEQRKGSCLERCRIASPWKRTLVRSLEGAILCSRHGDPGRELNRATQPGCSPWQLQQGHFRAHPGAVSMETRRAASRGSSQPPEGGTPWAHPAQQLSVRRPLNTKPSQDGRRPGAL